MIYDCIIIGAGPSGAQAGIYLARSNKKVLVFYSGKIGALTQTNVIENFYGAGVLSGEQLYKKGIDQLSGFGVDVKNRVVSSVNFDYDTNLFFVSDGEHEYKSRTIILAMGKDKIQSLDFEVNVKTGISYCALCDGFFYRNKKVAVIGESEFAFAEYNHLKDVTEDVTLLLNEKTAKVSDIEDLNTQKTKILKIEAGDEKNVKVIFKNGNNMEFDGVFLAEGNLGANSIAKILGLDTNDDGSIKVDEKMKTNIPGVFACGDIIGGPYQIAKAVCDGMKTGLSVINYLNSAKK